MSYWTFSDLFEEPGPPDAAFHGGFGMMTREGIRKPVWFACKYLAALQGRDGRLALQLRLRTHDVVQLRLDPLGA